MKRKIIIITVIITILVIVLLFISFKAFSFFKFKNDCIKKYTEKNGYSMTIYFKQDYSYEKINSFISKIRKFADVTNVSLKTSEDALNDFKERNKDNKEVLNQLNNLTENPLESSVILNSRIVDSSEFLELEEKLKNEAEKENLVIRSINDKSLSFYQEQLKKVKSASFAKDFLRFLFSGDGNRFFAKNYSPICYSNFLSNTEK